MANAVEASWYGHDYQARFFWIMAAKLRDPDHSYVIEVSYEADGPKAFDDVVVRYDPPRSSTGPHPVAADYHQIKFHVTQEGRFGYANLVDPEFIGAVRHSLLQRLVEAKASAPENSAFTLVTTDRVRDDDPLGQLISNKDGSIRLDRLFDGTGDGSKMGKIRKLWRDHLEIDDTKLEKTLAGFHIRDGHGSAEKLRDEVNLCFRIAGLVTCTNTIEFRFDAVARALKSAGRNSLTRSDFETLCVEQKWIRVDDREGHSNVAVRSFSDGPIDRLDAPSDRTLSLVSMFDGRVLEEGRTWADDVQPSIVKFLTTIKQQTNYVRLFLDAHLSIAFLSGALLGLKSGVSVELIQKGRAGTSVWKTDDGRDGPDALITTQVVSLGQDLAVVVSLSRNAVEDVQEYISRTLPEVGRILHVTTPSGPGPGSVLGGTHASRLTDNVANAVKDARLKFGATVHVFIAAPNGFAFLLGQHQPAMGDCVLYEYDFSRQIDASYHPTFRIN